MTATMQLSDRAREAIESTFEDGPVDFESFTAACEGSYAPCEMCGRVPGLESGNRELNLCGHIVFDEERGLSHGIICPSCAEDGLVEMLERSGR